MRWYDHDMNGWGFAGMGVGMLLFWALIIAGIVLVVRLTARDFDRPATPHEPPTAEAVLAQRFARGEIDDTEYARRLAVLRGQPAK